MKPNQFIAYYTLVRKEISRIFRIWSQTLLPPVINSLLYFIIFGCVIGSRLQNMQGASYIAYIAPGVMMMQMITAAYSNTTSTFFGAKFSRSIEELLVSPMSNHAILWGYISAGILRGFIVGGLVYAVAIFFTPMYPKHIFILLVSALLTTTLFSLLGLINGIYAKKFDDVSFIPNFILTPLTYLGGVFYAISSLPPVWQKISLFNPIVYAVGTFRYGFLGQSDVMIYSALMIIFMFVLALYTVCMNLLNKGIGMRS